MSRTDGRLRPPGDGGIDRFGVSWQIIPRQLSAMLQHADRAKSGRAMKAMMGMRKLDLAALQSAFDGV
jgi:hypothetical protein